MKLRFRQSGGFAGLERGCEIALKDLAPEWRKALEALQARPRLRKPAPAPASGADLTRYTIEVEGDGPGVQLDFDDATVPPAIAPLLTHLLGASKPLPRK